MSHCERTNDKLQGVIPFPVQKEKVARKLGRLTGEVHRLTWWGDGGGQLQLYSSDRKQELCMKHLQL